MLTSIRSLIKEIIFVINTLPVIEGLTHWGRDKMAANWQATFSNAFSWIKCLNFDYNFTEVCYQGSNWHYAIIGQIMAWRWTGGKPLSEPMMVSLMMHICVTRPQWVNHEAIMDYNKIRSDLNGCHFVKYIYKVFSRKKIIIFCSKFYTMCWAINHHQQIHVIQIITATSSYPEIFL